MSTEDLFLQNIMFSCAPLPIPQATARLVAAASSGFAIAMTSLEVAATCSTSIRAPCYGPLNSPAPGGKIIEH